MSAKEEWERWVERTETCCMCQGQGYQHAYGRSYAEIVRVPCDFCHGTRRVPKRQAKG